MHDSAIAVGLGELLKAYEYALDAGRAVFWDLAIEISLLCETGLTTSDLRWLVCKGYVEHARDITQLDDHQRSFRPCTELVFAKRSCFVLAENGAVFASHVLSKGSQVPTFQVTQTEFTGNNGRGRPIPPASPAKPQWNTDRRELRLNGILIKQFKWAAANQESILACLEEEGWPTHIDDPLPPQAEQDSKRRLSDTIKCLNRKQQNPLVHFRGDGTGEGVIWELVDPQGQ